MAILRHAQGWISLCLLVFLCTFTLCIPGCIESKKSAPVSNGEFEKGDAVHQGVKTIIGGLKNLSPKTISVKNDIRKDLAADDLDVVEIIMSVEEEFNVLISDKEALEVVTVDDLLKLIRAKKAPGSNKAK